MMNLNMLLLLLTFFSAFGDSLQIDTKFQEVGRIKRIIGGKPAEEAQYPWTVALYNEGSYVCTGSIISETAILTAAHCVVFDGVTQKPGDFYGVVGVTNRSSNQGVFLEFKDLQVHPLYDEMQSDVAILETTAPIEFGRDVQQICIANEKMGSLVFKKVVAMGWGQTNRDQDNPELPEMLQVTDQRVVANLKCYILFFGNPVPDTTMCATGIGSGICGGDSGGPLVLMSGNRPIQVGIASYVNGITGCGRLYAPAAFTRVSSFTEYIVNTATGDVCVA